MASQPPFESVLVTGGCGFIGHHIISKLLESEPNCQLSVLDADVDRNQFPSVAYYRCNISSKDQVQHILQKVKPQVIFHTECPPASPDIPSLFEKIIVLGTRNVLEAALAVGTVKAFVYHSSSSVTHDNVSECVDMKESAPYLRYPQQKRAYSLARVAAEELVIAANRQSGMLTGVIRPCTPFGEGDYEHLAKVIAQAESGKAKFQVGDGRNLFDYVYVGNLVHGHVLLAKALLKASSLPRVPESERVDGEAFQITNDEHWFFWDFTRAVAAKLGRPVRKEEIVVIPKAVGLLMALLTESIVWILSLGKRQSDMTVEAIRYSTITKTVNIDKAKRLLCYRPIFTTQEGLDRSVAWFMENKKTK